MDRGRPLSVRPTGTGWRRGRGHPFPPDGASGAASSGWSSALVFLPRLQGNGLDGSLVPGVQAASQLSMDMAPISCSTL